MNKLKLVPIEPTMEMLAAYLGANTAYWNRMDALPPPTGKWRRGTPTEATIAGYEAMLAAAPPQAACDWTESDPWGAEPQTYDSACGEKWSFTEGGAKENGVKFCHNCGKPVNVIPFASDEEQQ